MLLQINEIKEIAALEYVSVVGLMFLIILALVWYIKRLLNTFKKYCLVMDEYLINGFNGTKAWQKFYPDSSDESAANRFIEIVRISEVAEYLAKKQQDTAKKLQITLESQILELNELKVLAKDSEKYSDAINALKEQNKLLALYEDHNKQKAPIVSEKVTINFKKK